MAGARPPRAWLALTVVAGGLAVGAGSAWHLAGNGEWLGRVEAGGWRSNPAVGSADADPWTRAITARVGLLALARSEAVYYFRRRDDDGRPLDERCGYRIDGGALPARWWSITLYADDEFLARNDDAAHSVGSGHLGSDAYSRWQIDIAPSAPASGARWLSSRNAGHFGLALRLYHPEASVRADPSLIDPPRVKRGDCPRQVGA